MLAYRQFIKHIILVLYLSTIPFQLFLHIDKHIQILDKIFQNRETEVGKKDYSYCNMSNAPTQNGTRLEQHVSNKIDT